MRRNKPYLYCTVDLPAEFTVRLTSPEGSFLNGRCAWANWDVDELKYKAEQIQSRLLLTSDVYGWPFCWELIRRETGAKNQIAHLLILQ